MNGYRRLNGHRRLNGYRRLQTRGWLLLLFWLLVLRRNRGGRYRWNRRDHSCRWLQRGRRLERVVLPVMSESEASARCAQQKSGSDHPGAPSRATSGGRRSVSSSHSGLLIRVFHGGSMPQGPRGPKPFVAVNRCKASPMSGQDFTPTRILRNERSSAYGSTERSTPVEPPRHEST